GGNLRKLSAAVAFMANPQVVFLDEPTTGLDAVGKRKLWGIIRAGRNEGLTVILTSHSRMEECEALCTRIGIVIEGQFRCIGELNHLRNKFGQYFGKGYMVQVNVEEENLEELQQNLTQEFPGIEMEVLQNGVLSCNIPLNTKDIEYNLADIFKLFYGKKLAKTIRSYSISQTTLEQIFVLLAKEHEDRNRRKSSIISLGVPIRMNQTSAKSIQIGVSARQKSGETGKISRQTTIDSNHNEKVHAADIEEKTTL
ncbi:unnamed protein product, partial [Didymodactylos carnosus]